MDYDENYSESLGIPAEVQRFTHSAVVLKSRMRRVIQQDDEYARLRIGEMFDCPL
jgi:hypothetical protein